MTTGSITLSPRLVAALDEVEVAPDARGASVCGRDIDAETPHQLRQLLADELYQSLHVGRFLDLSGWWPHLRDTAFERRLAAAMPHRHTTMRLAVVDGSVDGPLLVERDGVRVWLPPDALVRRRLQLDSGMLVELDVEAARPALSPGFFLVDGACGGPQHGPLLRVYVHLADAAAALEAWPAALRACEALAVPYRAKVVSTPVMFPRHDALVVYLDAGAHHARGSIAEAMDAINTGETPVSAFAEPIGNGTAIGWQPHDSRPGMRALSFGEHRAIAVATGLIRHAVESPHRSRLAVVVDALRQAGIDPEKPARNLDPPVNGHNGEEVIGWTSGSDRSTADKRKSLNRKG